MVAMESLDGHSELWSKPIFDRETNRSMFIAAFFPIFTSSAQSGFSGTVILSNGRPASSAVVYLEGSVKSHPLKKAVVDQRDRHFIPHISVVTVGTRVQFPNDDVVFHNVFTEYHSTRFDLGMYARGKVKTQTFDRPGLAVLLCSIHSEMSAYVMCVDTPYYTIASKTGKFEIQNVPPGHYTLRCWQESGETDSEAIEVSSGGSTTIKLKR